MGSRFDSDSLSIANTLDQISPPTACHAPQVIGDGLRFHSDQARATEVAVAAQVLNRMLDLGRPNSVRVA